MIPTRIFLFFLTAAALATVPAAEISTTVKIDSVPFIEQKTSYCGPAALASVLQHYKLNITQDQIAEKIYNPKLNGTLITDLQNEAERLGFKTELGRGNIELIKEFIDRGQLVLVLIETGWWFISSPHYLVVFGYDNKGVIAHTGYDAAEHIDFDDLEDDWQDMGYSYLTILGPKENKNNE